MLQSRECIVDNLSLPSVFTSTSIADQLLMHDSEELFYQLGLRQFGRLNSIKLVPAASIRQLVRLAVDHQPEDRKKEARLTSGQIVDVRFLSLSFFLSFLLPGLR